VREDIAAQIAVAAVNIGVAPIVRVPEADFGMALRMLDAGALGIVVPDLTCADDAKRAVAHCKFAPLGQRSATGSYPHFGYRAVPVPQARAALDASTAIIAMVESKAALEHVEAIAAVPGVDIVHVGSNDLASDLGIPGQLDHPQVIAAIERVIAACRKHNKFPGVGGMAGGDTKRFEQVVSRGARFLSAANEWALLMAAGSERVRALRALLPQ
jgi:2-keto-3-deoxy-L-rhamnonate aldolase RhmA